MPDSSAKSTASDDGADTAQSIGIPAMTANDFPVIRSSSGSSPANVSCPLKARCAKAKTRSFSVTDNDEELVDARRAWRDDELRAIYRPHRPMAERSISWLVAKNNRRRLRYRGVERNEAWLHRRVAALNLRKLVVLGLTFDDGWKIAPT